MKDSFNYSGFSNARIASKKTIKDSHKHNLHDTEQSISDDPQRSCPPYLLQKVTNKNY